MRRGLGALYGFFRLTDGQRETKLGVERAGLDVVVGMCLDAGTDAQENLRLLACLSRDRVEQVDFVEIVHHDASHADFKGVGEFIRQLVVAVEVHAVQRKAGGDAHRNLTRRDHVQSHAFFSGDLDHVRVRVGLAGVEGERIRVTGIERVDVAAHVRAQGCFIIDIEGRAEFSCQFRDRHPAYRKYAALGHFRGNGQNPICCFDHLFLAPD